MRNYQISVMNINIFVYYARTLLFMGLLIHLLFRNKSSLLINYQVVGLVTKRGSVRSGSEIKDDYFLTKYFPLSRDQFSHFML